MAWKSELQLKGDDNRHKKWRVINVNCEYTWEYGWRSDTIMYAEDIYLIMYVFTLISYEYWKMWNKVVIQYKYSNTVDYSTNNNRIVCTLKS